MITEDFRLDFVGVGPQRTGTTWLHQLLQRHPELCLPQAVKETMFFDRYYKKGLTWYAAHFAQCGENQRFGEIAPTYFDIGEVPARIHQHNPDCRIIINLRNPVDHALSLYHHHLSKGDVSGSFAESGARMPKLVDSGRYTRHIPKWLDRFGVDRLKFVWFDEIHNSPKAVFEDICKFLEVELVAMSPEAQGKVYAKKGARYPWLARACERLFYKLRARRLYKIVQIGKSLGLDKVVYTTDTSAMPSLTESDRRRLLETYEPDILFLEDLLGRDLSAWRQPV